MICILGSPGILNPRIRLLGLAFRVLGPRLPGRVSGLGV